MWKLKWTWVLSIEWDNKTFLKYPWSLFVTCHRHLYSCVLNKHIILKQGGRMMLHFILVWHAAFTGHLWKYEPPGRDKISGAACMSAHLSAHFCCFCHRQPIHLPPKAWLNFYILQSWFHFDVWRGIILIVLDEIFTSLKYRDVTRRNHRNGNETIIFSNSSIILPSFNAAYKLTGVLCDNV